MIRIRIRRINISFQLVVLVRAEDPSLSKDRNTTASRLSLKSPGKHSDDNFHPNHLLTMHLDQRKNRSHLVTGHGKTPAHTPGGEPPSSSTGARRSQGTAKLSSYLSGEGHLHRHVLGGHRGRQNLSSYLPGEGHLHQQVLGGHRGRQNLSSYLSRGGPLLSRWPLQCPSWIDIWED
jgi:hypothetical protein